MKHLRLLFHVLIWLLTFTVAADAGPVAAAVAAVAASIKGILAAGGIGAMLLKAAVGVALNVGVSLLQRAMQKKPNEPGVQGQMQVGGDRPLSFILGRYATAGHLEYVNTHGQSGKTPNALLVQVVSVSDLPVAGLARLFVNGEACDLGATAHPDYGYPVLQYRTDGGQDSLWVKFYDGSQTVADPYLITAFGGDAERPWSPDMIGRGVAYAILTARYSRKVFTGPPAFLFEINGARLYDIRKDSTAGGSGSHRWDNPATWEPTNNPVVMTYNIARGIRYNGEWLYGGQNWPAFRLPASSWMAAANECDAPVELAGGGTEPQFRAGLEVTVDLEPLDVIDTLLKACIGRMAEIGGVYKIHVGAPALPVYSFSDSDIVVTAGQSFEPFPGLENTHNGMHASYPEPAEAWEMKDAPPRYNADYETADDGRRLVASAQLTAVPYSSQVQRLMVPMIEEERRFRKHVITLPPEAWLLEPAVDTVSWTSPRNGYTNKTFLIDAIDGQPGMNQVVAVREVDPSDYDFAAGDYLPIPLGPLGPIVPPPQLMVGWQVAPATIGQGTAALPSIEVIFAGDLEDVRAVRVQVRLAASGEVVFDGEIPYGDPATNPNPHSVILNGQFLPVTNYEARGVFVPFSGRATEWSSWLPVTTPNVWVQDIYPVDLGRLSEDVQDLLTWLEEGVNTNAEAIQDEAAARDAQIAAERNARIVDGAALAGSLRDLIETVNNQSLQFSNVLFGQVKESITIRQEVAVTFGDAKAYSDEQLNLAVGPDSALAGRLTAIEASVDSVESDLNASVTTLEEAIADGDANEASARQALAIQVRGSYTGTDVGGLSEGLLYNLNQARISDTEALAASISLVSAGVGILFDWQMGWPFDTSVDGWTGNGAATASGGWLRPANHATDPYVISPDNLSANGNAYRQIKVRVRKTGSPTWEGQFWWKGSGDATWDAGRRVSLSEPSYVDGLAVLTVDMTWSGTVKQVRIDLSSNQDAANYFEIDWVYIGRPSPGASQAQVGAVQTALSSAISAEAQARETLSTLLTGQADPNGLELSDLTSGLVYAERQARSTADAAMAQRIDAVESAIEDPETGLDALALAQDTLQSSVEDLGDQVSLNASNISDAVSQLANKASVAVTDSLQSQINSLGGGSSLVTLAQAIRSLQTTASNLALGQSNLFLGSQKQQIDLSNVTASVQQALTSRIEATEDSLTLLGQDVTAIQLTIPNLATASAVSALSSVVSDLDGEVTALSQSLTALETEVGGISSSLTIRAAAQGTVSGGWTRYSIQAKTGSGDDWSMAAFYMDAQPGLSRVLFMAEQFIITDGTNTAKPFVFSGSTAYLQNARIGTVIFDQLSSANGKLVMKGSGSNASIEVFT